jgi:hypothetical protein
MEIHGQPARLLQEADMDPGLEQEIAPTALHQVMAREVIHMPPVREHRVVGTVKSKAKIHR